MAINWIVALKAVPWTDLVQAAPSIVKGARKLFAGVRSGSAEATGAWSAGAARGPHASVEARLNEIESALAALGAEQRATAELIRSLAEQNARVVEAMSIIRARARILLGLCVVLTVAFIAFAAWVITK